jgi:hypothetical protein
VADFGTLSLANSTQPGAEEAEGGEKIVVVDPTSLGPVARLSHGGPSALIAHAAKIIMASVPEDDGADTFYITGTKRKCRRAQYPLLQPRAHLDLTWYLGLSLPRGCRNFCVCAFCCL